MNQLIFNTAMAQAIRDGRRTATCSYIDPQPTVTEEYLREREAWVEGFTLTAQVNAAFQSGFIPQKLAPVYDGQVVELIEQLSHGKSEIIGKALINDVSVSRVEELTDDDIAANGFTSWAHFSHSWDSQYPQHSTMLNPWCWVIRFEVLK
jgi:hypothetical protein